MTSSASRARPEVANVSTGSVEIDRRLGGGIPYRTLMLVEGQPASGKSTLSQQLLWGAIKSGECATIYATEQTVQSFLRQMDSLGMDITDYFLLDQLRIYPVALADLENRSERAFDELATHIEKETQSSVFVIDALTTLVAHGDGAQIRDFFLRCKSICDSGKVIICTVHSGAFDEDVLTRVRSICDAYLQLEVKAAGSQLLKTIKVAKIRGADSATGGIIGFEVEPGLGIRIIPISTARA